MGWLFGSKKKDEPTSLEEVIYEAAGVVSIFDWITPLFGIVETVYNDPTPLQSNSWTFFIPYKTSLFSRGWNGRDIEKLLKQHGIKTWGAGFGEGEFFTTVSLDQAQYAEHILLRHRVPINERFVGAPPPKPKKEKKGWW